MSDWQKILIVLLVPGAAVSGFILIDTMSESKKIQDRMPTALAECSNLQMPVPYLNETTLPTTVISTGTVVVEGYVYLCNRLKNGQITVVPPLEKGMPPKQASKE